MEVLLWIFLATIVNGLVALVGIFSLSLSERTLKKILLFLVAFSAGTLLAGAFFHLLPESLESMTSMNVFSYLILGFVLFFLIERFFHWHHCHETEKCDVHTFTYLILFGDGLHNFIDGLVIAASFLVNIPFGVTTTLVIIAHEIPQELGDFGALVYGGFSKIKALTFNLASQLTCVLGGMVGYLLSGKTEFIALLLPFAAGGFIYISASDLIPELHKEVSLRKSLFSFTFFLIGIGLMLGMKLLFEQ